jgi:hypothetical protein
MNDAEFIEQAGKQHLEIDEVGGERVAHIIENAFALPAEVVTAAQEAMNISAVTEGAK